MKNSKDKKKSILKICVLHFTLFSLVLSGVFFATRQVSNMFFQNAMPIIDDIMQYEDELKAEDYSAIPIGAMKNSSFAIFDENDKMIYFSSQEIKNDLSQNEMDFVSDNYDGIWFNVLTIKNDPEKSYIVLKSRYDAESKTDNVVGYCFLTENYEIVKGDLFSDRKSLTEKEFEILSSSTLAKKKNVEKASFLTYDSQVRTVAFVTPLGDQKIFEKAQNMSKMIWLVMIPFVLLMTLIETKIFINHIKKVFYPIDEAVKNYENSRRFEIKQSDIPQELVTFVYDFADLIDMLNMEKNKKEEAYKEKQRVFASLSHDLRTPLTIIQGYSKAFIDGVVPQDKKNQYLQAIYDRAESATGILDSVYEYSKLEHPDFKLDIQNNDFSEFCRAYIADKYSDLEFQGYVLDFSIMENPIMFSFDKALMKRLFNNIIDNSVKYNEKGVTIYFCLTETDNKILLTLGDNGKGIPKNVRENIFKPFVVGDEARSNNTGTGLGLTIANSIVNLHNGKMKLIYPAQKPYSVQIEITFSKLL